MNNGVTILTGTVCCNGLSLTVMPQAMMLMISLTEMRRNIYCHYIFYFTYDQKWSGTV